jgi:hypothetical protein
MELSRRPSEYTLPSYSLTGDIVSFLRCGLQYRYRGVGELPASRPAQLWFGQFIHGVLEEAFRRYEEEEIELPPWPEERIEEIRNLIKRRLAAQGLPVGDVDSERIADERAEIAINDLGPELFPLIHQAEVRLQGARPMPEEQIPSHLQTREADQYEISGIIDVVTDVQLTDPEIADNQLIEIVGDELPTSLPNRFEIIVDYKGMRRPPSQKQYSSIDYWQIYAWQTQTYARLRSKQQDSLPVVAGVIVYINELNPTRKDIEKLKEEIEEGETDVQPEPGSKVEEMIRTWSSGDPLPDLPFSFRLRRATRVIQTDEESIEEALTEFDEVVARIEQCHGQEAQDGQLIPNWEKNSSDPDTCAACDANTFCPSYTEQQIPRVPKVHQS